MYKHHIYLNTCINNKHINDHIEVANIYQKGEIKLTDNITNGEYCTKIEFIPKLNYYDRKINEYWDKLPESDQNRLIENGVIKKEDIKKNCVIEIKYKY
jgi:hypothetical protein